MLVKVASVEPHRRQQGGASVALATEGEPQQLLVYTVDPHGVHQLISRTRFPFESWGTITSLTWLVVDDEWIICVGTEDGNIVTITGPDYDTQHILPIKVKLPSIVSVRRTSDSGVLVVLTHGGLVFMSIVKVPQSRYKHQCPYEVASSKQQDLTFIKDETSSFSLHPARIMEIAHPYCLIGMTSGALVVLDLEDLSSRWTRNLLFAFVFVHVVLPDGYQRLSPCFGLSRFDMEKDVYNPNGPVTAITGVQDEEGRCTHIAWLTTRGRVCVIQRNPDRAEGQCTWHFWGYDFRSRPIPYSLTEGFGRSLMLVHFDKTGSRFINPSVLHSPSDVKLAQSICLLDDQENLLGSNRRLLPGVSGNKVSYLWTISPDGYLLGWQRD